MEFVSNPDNGTGKLELSEPDDALDVATKNWNRIVETATKTGYREGREDGSESIYQQGFDKGYEEAFKTAFALGKFKSLMLSMPPDTKYPPDVREILNLTRRGACYICKVKNEENIEFEEESMSEILHSQRQHSVKIIERLRQYFGPVTQILKFDIMDVVSCSPKM